MKRMKRLLSALIIVVLVVTSVGTLAPAERAEAAVSGQEIVNMAERYIGKVPYVWGGTKIDGESPGADCSGFICRIYEKFGIDLWAHRTKLRNAGTNIGTDLNQAQIGDIIWFDGHVAIYAGKSGSKHMIVHETKGSFKNVVRTSVDVVRADLLGIIRIPGVNGNTAQTRVTFSDATDPAYTSKASVTERNAVLVQKITKPSGTKVSAMGITLYEDNLTVKNYRENVSNVSASSTSYHSWFDVNKELGLTLEPGTVYEYEFYGIFDGKEVRSARKSFKTAGSATESNKKYDLTFCGTPSGYPSYSMFCQYGQSFASAFLGKLPTANVPDGYAFDYWYVVENGKKVPVDEGTLYRWTDDIKVYPAYTEVLPAEEPQEPVVPEEPETYTVSFVDLTNMLTYASYEIENGARFTLPSRTPAREGYTFLGWFTSASGGNQITANTVADLSGDVTFYARFEKVAEEPEAGRVEMQLFIGQSNFLLNGQSQRIDNLGTTPLILEGRTLLPVRAVIEGMGGTVDWDGSTRTVRLTLDGHMLYLMLDSAMAWDSKNDYYLMDVAPVSIGGRTMLPIRFVVEYFGGTVDWNGGRQTVTINYEK